MKIRGNVPPEIAESIESLPAACTDDSRKTPLRYVAITRAGLTTKCYHISDNRKLLCGVPSNGFAEIDFIPEGFRECGECKRSLRRCIEPPYYEEDR